MALNQHNKPKTLGILGTELVSLMQNQLWQGAMSAAQKHGVNLIYYPVISRSSAFSPQSHVLFDVVDTETIDGLLIWHGGIAEDIAINDGERFFDRYDHIPLITIGGQVKNHPSITIDNYQGTRTTVEHLIRVHGRRHIALIRGPAGHFDADERYRGYVAELEAQGLSLNPDFVALSTFDPQVSLEMSEAAVAHWLDNPNRKPDAVVAGSDYMALGAIKAIEAFGLGVPDDIAVVGFDDIDDSQASIPSITTVRQPSYDMGFRATEMLLALINGQRLPSQSRIPAQLVVRESCGCTAGSVLLADITTDSAPESNQGSSNTSYQDSLGALKLFAPDLGIPFERIENLAALLQSELNSDKSQRFLSALRLCLIDSAKSHQNLTAWQNAISVLRKYWMRFSTRGAVSLEETLFDHARVMVADLSRRAYIREQLNSEVQIEKLRRISEGLITSFGTQLLLDTLEEHLPNLGFPSFYLSLYEDPEQSTRWSRLILAYQNKQRLSLPPEGLRILTHRLIPESSWLAAQSVSIVVEPLYFRDQQLGIVVLGVGPTEGGVYETIRTQISSAIQGSRLVQEIQRRASQMEQRVSERTAELTQAVELLRGEIAERKQAEVALQRNEEHALAFQEKLKALQEVSLELAVIESPEQMCLRAIELGRSRLGYDRIGLLVYDNPEKSRVSRFGIESNGELRVELGMSYSYEDSPGDRLLMEQKSVIVNEDSKLHDFEAGVAVGQGWNMMAGIRDANTGIGWLAADNLFRKKPLKPYQIELHNLYGLTLGHLLTRKRAEAEIRDLNDKLEQRVIARTKALEDANQEIRHFAYIVSHDLRAPLVNLKGFSGELRHALEIMKDGCSDVLGYVHPDKRERMLNALHEDIPEALRFIESAVDNMDTFTKAILKLSRLGRLQLDLTAVDVRSIVERVLKTLNYQLDQRRVRVSIGDLPVVTADSVSMEQIFGNILSNAVAYLDPERSGEIEIKAERAANETIFRIRDNGRGIAAEDMEKVFAPFRRAGKQDTPGEGMGLAYVQTLVRRHGGRIWCVSELDLGTTFSFTIPENPLHHSVVP